MNPILFLDFDGVTHPEVCTAPELFTCLPLIEAVLLRHSHVCIVISSAWREHHGLEDLQTRSVRTGHALRARSRVPDLAGSPSTGDSLAGHRRRTMVVFSRLQQLAADEPQAGFHSC